MSDSVQHKLSRVRPPRVQITYDVETGGAMEKKEIPFIVGIIAPLSGKSKKVAPPMSEKKLVEIDRDNINKICESINPRVAFEVPNTLSADGGSMPVSVEFSHIDDFDPIPVLVQIDPLNQLYQERSRLRDFLAKLDGNAALHALLLDILTEDAKKDGLKAAIAGALEAVVAARALDNQKETDTAILAAFADQLPDDGDTEIKTLVTKGDMILEESQKPYVLELITEFVVQLVENADLLPAADAPDAIKNNINVGGIITRRIGQKDKLISRQLNHIIHHDDFQTMEASWRGLHFLVMNTETNAKLKLRLLNVTYDELYKDLDKAVEFDQSALFRLVYEDEYGTYGGNPYSVLIGDFQLGRTAKDIQFLEMISGVAAAAHAPFIASAWAKLFDMEDYANLFKPRDLSKIFESAELIQWRAFRERQDSRYVTLALPKVMLRLPYHHENNPVDGIYFDEDMAVNLFKIDKETQETELDAEGNPVVATGLDEDGFTFEKTLKNVDARKVLWGNPAYVLGQRITNAFSLYGWTAAIRGVEGGGLVEGLPAYTFETEDGDIALTCPTQVSITDRREKELNDLGFMAICHCKGTNKAAFFGGQSTNKPKMYLTDSATVNAQISSMLPYIMSASRFAHYIKVIMREKIGSFMTRQNVSDYLNTWIAQYVLLDDTAPQHIKAKFPLREANIVVTDIAGKVGAYRATVFLRPHFQLEELSTSIRLVAELPS